MECDVCGVNSAYCQQYRDKRFTYCVGALPPVSINGGKDGKSLNITLVSPPDRSDLIRQGSLIINCDPNSITPNNIIFYTPPDIKSYRITYNSIADCGSPV